MRQNVVLTLSQTKRAGALSWLLLQAAGLVSTSAVAARAPPGSAAAQKG
ncbi:hypothetical protein [Sorangium sp. So ce426]